MTMKQFIRNTHTATQTSVCIFAVTALLLASCSQDELPGTGDTNGTPQGISALHIASASLQAPEAQPGTRNAANRSTATTRATASASLTSGSIGIFRSQGTGYTEAQDNKQYTYDAATTKWQPSTIADTVYLMANDVDVCAYYPYNSAYTDKTKLPLASAKYAGTVDDLTKHDPADLCYATNRTMNGANVTTAFEMQHAMAMVQLSFKRLNYASDACNLTSISIKNKELISTATLNIADGTYTTVKKAAVKWTPGTADPTTGNTATGIQVPASGVSEITTALLVPCTLDAAGSTTFTFTVDGLPMSVKVPAAKLPAFEAGKIHKLKFTIHAASVSLSYVSVIDWVPAWADVDNPNYDGTSNDYLELGGVKWALRNLNYNSNYGTYSFAPMTATAFTTLHWNALTESATGNSTKLWDAYSDPCTRIEPKGTWTMPTQKDFEALITLPRVWNNAIGERGQWFGTDNLDEAKLHPDRYLFLPISDMINRSLAYYWTQTYGTKNCPITFYIDGGSPKIETDFAHSGWGVVRCVKRPQAMPIDLGLPFIVAPGNLIATAAGSGYTYSFADEQGFYTTSGGNIRPDYFSWNTLSPADAPTHASWEDSRDPCRKIGNGQWYTPSQEQWKTLTDMGYVLGNYTLQDGKTKKYGLYIGTKSQPTEAAQDNYVFLPCAGHYDGRGWGYVGNAGLYWSNTPVISDKANEANYLYFFNFNGSPYVTETGGASRFFALAVRCVRDRF